jgi:hypothetical protein
MACRIVRRSFLAKTFVLLRSLVAPTTVPTSSVSAFMIKTIQPPGKWLSLLSGLRHVSGLEGGPLWPDGIEKSGTAAAAEMSWESTAK